MGGLLLNVNELVSIDGSSAAGAEVNIPSHSQKSAPGFPQSKVQ